MKSTPRYRKFNPFQKKIQALEQSSPRFKRIFSEYTTMSKELWNLENSGEISVADDFINYISQQTSYLEDEIEDWLSDYPKEISE